MTPKQQSILAFVRLHQPVTRQQVREACRASDQYVKESLQGLVKCGLLAKGPRIGLNHSWVLASAKASRPWAAAEPPQQRRAYEQAASVWQYADRCRRKSR